MCFKERDMLLWIILIKWKYLNACGHFQHTNGVEVRVHICKDAHIGRELGREHNADVPNWKKSVDRSKQNRWQ